MKTCLAVSAFAFLALAGAASAQIAVQPGTEFPAAPISKGGFSLFAPSQIIAPAPAVAPVVAPPPEPAAPTKRRKRRRS